MNKTIRLSEEFHAFITAHSHDDETMEETLRRLIGGPHPEHVAGILSSETAEAMRTRLEETGEAEVTGKHQLRDRFE